MQNSVNTPFLPKNQLLADVIVNARAQMRRAFLKGGVLPNIITSSVVSLIFSLLLNLASSSNVFSFTIPDILSGSCLATILVFSIGTISYVCRDIQQGVITYEKSLFHLNRATFWFFGFFLCVCAGGGLLVSVFDTLMGWVG